MAPIVTRRFPLRAAWDAHPDLDFLVHYSTPPYNSPASAPHQPGWLAIHDATNGAFISAYQLPL